VCLIVSAGVIYSEGILG